MRMRHTLLAAAYAGGQRAVHAHTGWMGGLSSAWGGSGPTTPEARKVCKMMCPWNFNYVHHMQPLKRRLSVCVDGASQLSHLRPCADAATAVSHRKMKKMSRPSRRAPSFLHLASGRWLRVLFSVQLMLASTIMCQLHENEWAWRRVTPTLFDGQRGYLGEGLRREEFTIQPYRAG